MQHNFVPKFHAHSLKLDNFSKELKRELYIVGRRSAVKLPTIDVGDLGVSLPSNSLDLGTSNTKTTRSNLELTPRPYYPDGELVSKGKNV